MSEQVCVWAKVEEAGFTESVLNFLVAVVNSSNS